MDPIVLKVHRELKQQNDITGFIAKFSKNEGFAFWDKATFSIKNANSRETNGDTIVIVPLILIDDNKVNAYVKAVINDSITLSLERSSDYSKYTFGDVPVDSMNADKYALLMMKLTKYVFGNTKFRITDNRLFTSVEINDPDEYRIVKLKDSSEIQFRFDVVCWHTGLFHCVRTDPCTVSSCDGCPLCITWYAYTCEPMDTEPMPGPTPGSGGGGGGDGECREAPVIIGGNPPCPGPGGGGGWVPLPQDPDPMPTPCEKIQVLKNSSMFRYIFNELRDEAMNPNTNHESAYRFTEAGPYTKEIGDPFNNSDYPSVNIPLNDMLGVMHTHPGPNTLPIFSPEDLNSMYQILTGINSATGLPFANYTTFT